MALRLLQAQPLPGTLLKQNFVVFPTKSFYFFRVFFAGVLIAGTSRLLYGEEQLVIISVL